MLKIVLYLSGLLLSATSLSEQNLSGNASNEDEVCNATDERGMPRLMYELRSVLPVDRLQNIMANAAAYDPEVFKLRQVLHSAEFLKKLKNLSQTNEHRELFNYSCHNFHMNYPQYVDFVRLFMNIHTTEEPTEVIDNPRQGVHGLLDDLYDALPKRQIRKVFRHLVREDQELADFVCLTHTRDFQQLVRNYRELTVHHDIRKTLESVGVCMLAVERLIDSAFGWDYVEVGSEKAIWNV